MGEPDKLFFVFQSVVECTQYTSLLGWSFHIKVGFILECFLAYAFPFFEVISVYPIDPYQNSILRAMLFNELKNVQLQECFTLMTHDSIGCLKTLCMSIFCRAVAWSLNENAAAQQ